jgi:ubiquinone/menaquinone biosynthesis C-methylase UbiE
LEVLGIDVSARAIEIARGKATERKLTASFQVANALRLEKIGRKFDTAVDTSFFHLLAPAKRRGFAENLRKVLKPCGRYYSLGLSDEIPNWTGRPSVSKQSIMETFNHGWKIEYIRDAVMEHPERGEFPARLFAVTKLTD